MSRLLRLFRAWIPSWRFFETLSEQPVLYYRAAESGKELGEWRQALKRPPRKWYSLLLNGEGNLHLARYALLDQLEDDLGEIQPGEADEFPHSVSYGLVKNLVCQALRENHEWPASGTYQFKVCRVSADTPDAEEILVSPVYST